MRAKELTELAEQSLRDRGATWMRREVPNHNAAVRADVAALVDGKIVFVEIKGDGDSSRRLEGQLLGYGPSADQIEVWASEKLVASCQQIAGSFGYATIRSPSAVVLEASSSPPRVVHCVLSLLNGPELIEVAEARGWARGIRGKSKRHVLDRLLKNGISADEARAEVARLWPVRDWDWYKRQRLSAMELRA